MSVLFILEVKQEVILIFPCPFFLYFLHLYEVEILVAVSKTTWCSWRWLLPEK